MGNGCSCMTSAPKEHNPYNIEFPSHPDSSNDSLMGSASRPILSNAHSFKHKNYTRSLKDRNYLIQILKATDIPLMAHSSHHSHVYIVLKILDIDTNAQNGDNITSLHHIHTATPIIWNCYRAFKASEFHDKLMFEIWHKSVGDADTTKQDLLIGSGEAHICEGFVNVNDHHTANGQLIVCNDSDSEKDEEDEDCLREVIIHLNGEKQATTQETKLYFKLFAMKCCADATVERKTIFFIRNTHTQMCDDDDALSVEGMDHAMKLNEIWKLQKEKDLNANHTDLNDFLSSQVIYSSPFCPATQTALLALLNHPCLERKGIHYASNLRDIKLAHEVQLQGSHPEPVQNAIRHIAKYSHTTQINAIHAELNDCSQNQQWWNGCVDTKTYFQERLSDFMYYIRYSNEALIICVGHSLWFKGFLKRYVNANEIEGYTSKHVVRDMIRNKIFDEQSKNEMIANEKRNCVTSNGHTYTDGTSDHKCTETDDLILIKHAKSAKGEEHSAECFRVNIAFSDQFENGLQIEDVRLLFNEAMSENTDQKETVEGVVD